MNEKLRLLRNHGLADRDTVLLTGYNSRLDSIQAVVGNWLLPRAKSISKKRIVNANYLDKGLGEIGQIKIPPRPDEFHLVYHLYIVFAENRDKLLQYCIKKEIEAKIHYPTPIYLQKALAFRRYKNGVSGW